jgi:hypothetical protein
MKTPQDDKTYAERHEGNVTSFVWKLFDASPTPDKVRHILAFGDDAVIDGFLKEPTNWTALSVYPPDAKLPKPNLRHKRIKALVHPDPKLVPVFGGYFIRPITVKEIFDQFHGPYGVISVNLESMSRMVWESAQIQDHLPYIYILPEDGHNEGVMHRAWDRGYSRHLVEDRLVLVKDYVMGGP